MSTFKDTTSTLVTANQQLTTYNLVVQNAASVASRTTLYGPLLVENDATITGTLDVDEDINAHQDVNVDGTVYASGFEQKYQPSSAYALLVPPGSIVQYVGATAPNGWWLCDGSALSRTSFSQLYAVIGTTFGVGDGSTTFNVPDFRGRVAVGAGAGAGLTVRAVGAVGGQESITQVPPHTHNITDPGHTHTYLGVQSQDAGTTGSTSVAENDPRPVETSGSSTTGITVNNTGTNIAGAAVNTMNPFLVATYIIKV